MEVVRLGRIVNGYSNYLTTVAVDAKYAPAWRGSGDDEDENDDFSRATSAISRRRYEIAIGDGKGIAFAVGGCGSSEVHRIGNALVLVEHFSGDDDADAEADLERAIASTPTRKPKKLGTVDVKSGALCLLDPLEPGKKVATPKTSKQIGCGLVIAVKPGKYDIWREELGELEGDWGLIHSRTRIVPAGTKVVAGAPIAELPPAPKPRVAAQGGRRLAPKKWLAISSMAIAGDGRAFAGENGGYSVCAWNAVGERIWERELKKRGKQSRYLYEVGVQLVDDVLLAHCKGGDRIWMLEAATGKILHQLSIPATRTFMVSPDRERLVLRVDTETTVLAYPTLDRLAHFDAYCNGNCIAISRDSRFLVVNGHEVHLFDLDKLTDIASIEPKLDPYETCFLPDGRFIVGGEKARVTIHDTKTARQLASGDAAPDRKAKPSINVLAASERFIAVGREDGTVALLDGKLRVVRQFEKHEVSIPGTGATGLSAVALVGNQLWVGAGPKKQPIGLSVYELA